MITQCTTHMLDHRYCGKKLKCGTKPDGLNFICSVYKEILRVMNFLANKSPLSSFMFEDEFSNVEPIVWWKTMRFEH